MKNLKCKEKELNELLPNKIYYNYTEDPVKITVFYFCMKYCQITMSGRWGYNIFYYDYNGKWVNPIDISAETEIECKQKVITKLKEMKLI